MKGLSEVIFIEEWFFFGDNADMSRNLCTYSIGKGGFAGRKHVLSLLESPDFEGALKRTDAVPEKIINPLLCFLYDTNETIRWRAVRGVGITVSTIAGKDLESARTIMRRLIWSLNDESGGIGWGAPEAMGEIMAENEAMAREYHRILVSYIDENGNPLGNDELERGVMWGINRLAQKRSEFLREWTAPISAQLSSSDLVKAGLALRTLTFLVKSSPGGFELDLDAANLAPLLQNQTQIRIFRDGSFETVTIGRLAEELVDGMRMALRRF
jgi:hypothetical protein